MMRLGTAVLVGLLLFAAAGCGGGHAQKRTRRASQSTTANAASAAEHLIDLRGIRQLRSLFNAASGEPRLIVLVSPT